jgi:predicted ATP-grasp superfamily ATP-dependent carboligase
MHSKVLVAGVSTRAAAESAARAGFAVTAIDAFADVDQHPSVRALSLGDEFSPAAAARHGRNISCDAVAYGSNFENHPRAVALLTQGRVLWGNAPDVVRRVRDPKLLSDALRRRGLAAPAVADDESQTESQTESRTESRTESQIPNPKSQVEWLLKPRASGGGHGIRRWQGGGEVPHRYYLQERIDGTPASIVFVACGGAVVPLGFSRQLLGLEEFGVSGYRYCGNILTAGGEDDDVLDAAHRVAAAIAEEFGLVGLNGIDLVVRDRIPYVVEVNPRWCASMELVERTYGLSVFGAHAAACSAGSLPMFDLASARRGATASGKAILFARRDCSVGDLRVELKSLAGAGDLRDIPHAGRAIRQGRPICTVFAAGRNATACRAELVRRAAAVETSLTAML